MVPRTFVPVCNCRRGLFALQCHKSPYPLQTCLQEGMGLDGTPLHEHEETIVSRVRMQAGIVKARSAGDSVKEKQKKKAKWCRNRKSAKRGRFRKRKEKENLRSAGIVGAQSANDSVKENLFISGEER